MSSNALAHGGEAKIGAVGDHDGEQRTIDVTVTRLVPAKRLEGGDEAAPFVNVLQQILDPDTRHACFDRRPQMPHRPRDRQRVGALELQFSVLDRCERVGGQAASRSAGGLV